MSEGAGDGAPAPAPAAPANKPIDGVALAKEVALDRIEHLLQWLIARMESLLARLRGWRERRGNWWE